MNTNSRTTRLIAAGALTIAAVPWSTTGAAPPTCNGLPATIVGNEQHDVLYGTQGDDVIVAGGGNDTIYTFDGNDTICAGPATTTSTAAPDTT